MHGRACIDIYSVYLLSPQSKPGMARAQTNGGRDDSQQGGPQSCRMEALQPEAWLTCNLHSLQPALRPCCQWRVRTTPSNPTPVCPPQEPTASTSPSDIADSAIPQRTGKALVDGVLDQYIKGENQVWGNAQLGVVSWPYGSDSDSGFHFAGLNVK